MSWSDPISDMVIRVSSGLGAGREVVDIPHSRMKAEVVRVLKREGFIKDYAVEGGAGRKLLRVYLKYADNGKPVIRRFRKVSKGGLRKYVASKDIPRVLGGMGLVILSTSSGIMSGKEARQKGIGGELLCLVW